MERRNFFKILSSVSAGVAATSCTKKSDTIIPLLVPDREIVPGEEQWHPAVCGECSAGCGTIVRVMEGERTIELSGRKFRERIACIKKVEGNPLDPVSGGRLCARGQAAVQSLYNPDRVTGPLRRKGARGSAEFILVSWDEAIAAVASALTKQRSVDPGRILLLTGPQAGSRTVNLQNFLSGINAPPPLTCSLGGLAVERKASDSVFGWKGVPVYDLAQARYVLGVGADFLGSWASPVYYARQYGAFRQGRPGIRGRLVQAESRMSLTAASADEWLPLQPGSEPQFLTAVSRLLLDIKPEAHLQQISPDLVESIRAVDVTRLSDACGVDPRRIQRIAQQLGESEAPLVIAGASYVHTNSLEALTAAHYLNLILGVVGKPGGVLPPNDHFSAPVADARYSVADRLASSKILLLDGENPVYSLPPSAGTRQALTSLEMIVSLSPFINDSAAYADWILPDHYILESANATVPAVSPCAAIAVSLPFVKPLYNTRPLEQTLAEIARKVGASFEPVTPESYVKPFLAADEEWDQVARQGGLWRDRTAGERIETIGAGQPRNAASETPAFHGDANQFPFYFQPYLSLQYHDGSGANLPWMQELPDPSSSAMWSIPVELDPQAAARLNVSTGDWVRVESPVSALDAPAYVHPGAIRGVVSMAIGQGHSHYGRYASGRGANPIGILAPVWEPSTGTLAIGATRVRIIRIAAKSGGLIQFSPRDREQGPWGYR